MCTFKKNQTKANIVKNYEIHSLGMKLGRQIFLGKGKCHEFVWM